MVVHTSSTRQQWVLSLFIVAHEAGSVDVEVELNPSLESSAQSHESSEHPDGNNDRPLRYVHRLD